MLADVDQAENQLTAEMVSGMGGHGEAVELDVSDSDQWRNLAERLRNEWDQIDLLVNNAGVAAQGEVGDLPLDRWQWVLDASLHGTINGCHTFVPWLKENPRGGHIINTASFAAFVSAPSMGAYNVAKAGVVSLSETLYGELRPHQVGVTVVCPAFFQTRLLDRGEFRDEAAWQIARDYTDNARLTAESVAKAAIRAMDRKRLYVVLRKRARWYWRAKRLFPTRFHKLLSKGYFRQLAKVQSKNKTNDR